jgi:hypothetical protein
MSQATEVLEHMEHAGHAGHSHGPGKQIGVTMALLGVALALCAAMVGSQRTELIRTMVEQSNKIGLYHTETMKFRVAEGNLELLKAISPKKDEVEKIAATLKHHRKANGDADSEDTAEIKELIATSTEDMADFLTPDPEEVVRFKTLSKTYERDMHEAKEDAEAYDLSVEAYREGAEGYERAQLAAEIGIVIASVALLMASRRIWYVSVAFGLLCLGTGGVTYASTQKELAAAEQKIKNAAANAAKMEEEDEEEGKKDVEGAEGKPGEKSEKPAEKTGPAEPAKPSESAAPDGSAKGPEPSSPATSAKPVESARPATSAKPAGPKPKPELEY